MKSKSKSVKVPAQLKAGWQFFMEHAGYSTPPGKSACALSLARAEITGKSIGLRFEWTEDACGCIGCDCGSPDCKCSTGEAHECLSCACYSSDGELLASLGSICEPSKTHRRVIEAELASEALAEAEGRVAE